MRDFDAYETINLLGTGQYGDVTLVRRKADRKLFAAKIPHGESIAARHVARQEAQLLKRLHHMNIIQMVELIENDSQFALVMEYASGGDLEAFLRWQQEGTGHLSESAIMRIFIQIVLALQYLHEHHILHRDLKPKNILMDGDGIIKLSDFGVSKLLDTSLDLAQTITGTPHYMAPELLEGNNYDYKSDIWSLGCVLYELAMFSRPFNGNALGAVVGAILYSEPPPIALHYCSQFRVLVTNLLEKDPTKRPSLLDILRLDVVQSHMLQLISVATSHQPMLLDEHAATLVHHNVDIPLELVQKDESNLASDTIVDLVKLPLSQQTDSDHARQLFFENQAAARRNKERFDLERSCSAVFLDFGATDRDDFATAQKTPKVTNLTSKSISSRLQMQTSSKEYEDLLHAERLRVQAETKALQERMRSHLNINH